MYVVDDLKAQGATINNIYTNLFLFCKILKKFETCKL